MILFIDLSNSVVGNGQALLRATGRLHHGMPGDLKCGHTEFEAYVSWNLVFGLFTYIFTNAASHYKIHGLENYAKFSITVACHSLVMWLVAASIYTACTDIGHKMYVPFGVTTCVVFSAFVLPCLYYITQQSTPAPDLSDLAVATETDKPSNKTAAGPMFFTKVQVHHLPRCWATIVCCTMWQSRVCYCWVGSLASFSSCAGRCTL